jgi:threonylcarbamoyladenosine tRNA methylthiotransferase CDKAL1
MTKIFIKTYGCQANKSDSEIMLGILEKDGFKIVKTEKEANLIIVNSCSVKSVTQEKIIGYINGIPKDKKIIVGGCLPKTIDLRTKTRKVDAILDTNSITKISKIVKELKDYSSDKKEERILVPRLRLNKDIAIIVINQGCLNACSFCATKTSRGNLFSYRIGDIKRALEQSVKDGCTKIYLTGQDTGCYGFDIKTSLPELLNEITKVPGNYKIRVGMMNPWHAIRILDELVEAYKNPKIVKFLHIPIQSGSEKILKDMKRVHTVETFKKIVHKFRENFSNMNIDTDVIIGYPTETEEDFQKTYDLIKEIKPEVVNISRYASRPKTSASKLKQINTKIMKQRSSKLTELYNSYYSKKEKIDLFSDN